MKHVNLHYCSDDTDPELLSFHHSFQSILNSLKFWIPNGLPVGLLAFLEVGAEIFLFLFFFFWLCHAAYRILVPQPGIEPVPPAVEVQS